MQLMLTIFSDMIMSVSESHLSLTSMINDFIFTKEKNAMG